MNLNLVWEVISSHKVPGFCWTLVLPYVLQGGKFSSLENFRTLPWWLWVFLGAHPKDLEPFHFHTSFKPSFYPPFTIAEDLSL